MTYDNFLNPTIIIATVENGNELPKNNYQSNIIIEYNTIDPFDGPNNGVEGWFEISSVAADERTVFAYNYQLDQETGITTDLIKSIKIDDQVLTAASYDVDPDTGEVTTTYEYDDLYFCIEVGSDAIQAYNSESQNVNTFINSWGWTPIFQDGYLIGLE